MKTGGVSGIGLMVSTTGALLIASGIKDVPMLELLRGLAAGQMPAGAGPKVTTVMFTPADDGTAPTAGAQAAGYTPPGSSAGAGSGGAHPAIYEAARSFIGVPYLWGGKSPKGLDCSGLVKLSIQIGTGDATCPGTSWGQSTWRRLDVIDRADVGAGDVLWWPGHVVVAASATQCISAPRPGLKVRQEAIRTAGSVPGEPVRCLRYNGGTKATTKPAPVGVGPVRSA